MCRELCKRYKFTCVQKCNGFYGSGARRCQMCEIYLDTKILPNPLVCPCCNYRLRLKPRNKGPAKRRLARIAAALKVQKREGRVKKKEEEEGRGTKVVPTEKTPVLVTIS